MMRVLITGANGFVGKNLMAHLAERTDVEVVPFTRDNVIAELPALLESVDLIFHLAGTNRPDNISEFEQGNVDLTASLCDAIRKKGNPIPVVYTSSIQAELDNPYGVSKRRAEDVLLALSKKHSSPVYIYRLPNVFGKWARPNYNSAVATFCHNVSNKIPLKINDASALISLVYIDDVVEEFMSVLDGNEESQGFVNVDTKYEISVGRLAEQLIAFRDSRESLISEDVGTGLVRALYATYVSYLTPGQFSYSVPKYGDERGCFVEMLKTKGAGQFSYFTAFPGITRGGHYHHSKTEKFLVIKGKASFRFRHIETGEFYEQVTDGDSPEIIETVTGWTHDITNIGADEMVVMLWANEIFDRDKPDTYSMPLGN
jgi:UDP-2-acetamido-2,6-beta-L-arabino-hexul-4-ose reductase